MERQFYVPIPIIWPELMANVETLARRPLLSELFFRTCVILGIRKYHKDPRLIIVDCQT